MNMRTATKTVLKAFSDAWGSTTPIVMGNESASEAAAPWVRASTRENSSIQLTMGSAGNRIFERRCSARVQIFSPADAGEGPLLDLAQSVRDVFEGVSLTAGGEPINFFQVDWDRNEDEPHLIVGTVHAQFRFQQRK